jgi:hypothetical protein
MTDGLCSDGQIRPNPGSGSVSFAEKTGETLQCTIGSIHSSSQRVLTRAGKCEEPPRTLSRPMQRSTFDNHEWEFERLRRPVYV